MKHLYFSSLSFSWCIYFAKSMFSISLFWAFIFWWEKVITIIWKLLSYVPRFFFKYAKLALYFYQSCCTLSTRYLMVSVSIILRISKVLVVIQSQFPQFPNKMGQSVGITMLGSESSGEKNNCNSDQQVAWAANQAESNTTLASTTDVPQHYLYLKKHSANTHDNKPNCNTPDTDHNIWHRPRKLGPWMVEMA